MLTKSAEASFAQEGPQHLGLNLDESGLSGSDLLAETLLAMAGGDDPDPEQVRSAAPAPRTIIDLPDANDTYIEHIVFGDVAPARDRFIIQTWHRSVRVERGTIAKTVYGYAYPALPPARQGPPPDAFYRALLAFADYRDAQLADIAPATLPDRSWIDLSTHGFAKELMMRPGGLSPKYGAVNSRRRRRY